MNGFGTNFGTNFKITTYVFIKDMNNFRFSKLSRTQRSDSKGNLTKQKHLEY